MEPHFAHPSTPGRVSSPSPYPSGAAADPASIIGSVPTSPTSPGPQRPMSAMVRPTPRSQSRMSVSSKNGGSRASDEDSRTSVKVAVRVRPPLKPSDPGYELIPQRFQRSMVQVTSNTNLAIDSPQGRKLFVFDRVFGSDVDQEGVWDYLTDSVDSFTTGYNVSLLAYGQSGSGKSYTMGTSGPAEQSDSDVMGVIPRAANALFEKLEGRKPQLGRGSMSHLRTPKGYNQQTKTDKNWTLKATYVEIYNEHLRDLLIPEHVPTQDRATVTIREDVKGNILLTGLRQVEINSVDDLLNALNFGSTLRQTDATAMNARSSRSHAVFSLNLVQRRNGFVSTKSEKRMSVPLEAMTGTESWVTIDSKLHFVDLAGSERLKNTGAQGERAKEGISINAGLAALGKVISQLSSRQPGSHVSYRDSRLTRLLQDSLGGNAITYMIACVTPAEFHLSETLNTVQYAQRARAIQSKPRIQQVEEGDKQAIIDRLKAEVAFLRDQIRSASSSGSGADKRTPAVGDRTERQGERDVEMQNALLDAQENYTALSQRHAKLIAEMAKARDNELAQNESLADAGGDSATERLNRSSSFAHAVEQVVLEYEKTIQSLEQSLSSTRATLSGTETNLLEKESKCTYVEAMNAQLQARLQKVMLRETNTESYLNDLETKLDSHTSGEEKNATIISELRKEMSRIRENEATCEDYISTLEERLAEADQDSELMQREIDRLEQVIERQRSLGKLDSLLYELDHIQQQDGQSNNTSGIVGGAVASIEDSEVAPHTNGVGHRRTASRGIAEHSRSQSHVSRHSHDVIFEEEDDVTNGGNGLVNGNRTKAASMQENGEYQASPAQTKFVADKLESVTQELFDLRVEHESTVNDYNHLNAKYEEALHTLAELQDAVDEAHHNGDADSDSVLSASESVHTAHSRPSSMLSDTRSIDAKASEKYVQSQSLSSELSSAVESSTRGVSQVDSKNQARQSAFNHLANGYSSQPADAELEQLRLVAAEKEAFERDMIEKYTELEKQHHQTLDEIEELKTEFAKAQAAESLSPRSTTPIIRRKSNQNVMIIDRAHRSFASLRNIAAENFEDNPDVMQSFELNLNSAMHELHARSERIQELEADLASGKKEMETKMALISGLTRERSSLKSSPMDMSVVSTLRDQLEQNELQLKTLKETQAQRERQLQSELEKAVRARDVALQETATHRGLVSELEEKVTEHKKTIAGHHEHLVLLQANHAKELNGLTGSSRKQYDEDVQVLMAEHAENIRILESDLTEAREDLMKVATQVAFALGLDVSVEKINERIDNLIADHKTVEAERKKSAELQTTANELSNIGDSVMRDLEEVRTALATMAGLDAAKELENPGTTVTEQLAAVQKRMNELESKNKKNSRLVDELEEQLQTNFDHAQLTNNRMSTLQTERSQQLEDANSAKARAVAELEALKEQHIALQARLGEQSGDAAPERSNSTNSQLRKSASVASLPSPPPAIPLPPLPSSSSPPPTAAGASTGAGMRPPSKEVALQQIQQDQEARIRTIEKHLDAEKQLTATLEEALTDLEDQSKKMKTDCDAWKRRCTELEVEVKELKDKPAQDNRWSLHQVEEERKKRRDAEIARAHLEERMNAINKKKKKGGLNCF